MNLSFRLTRKVRAISDRPFEQKKNIEQPAIGSITESLSDRQKTINNEVAESPPDQPAVVPDESDIQERIYQQAQNLANELVEKNLQPLRQMLQTAIAELEKQKQTFFDQIEEAAVRLAREMAKKIVRKELETTTDIIVTTVKEVIARLAGAEKLVLRCHPEDAKLLMRNQSFQEWLKQHESVLKIIDDENIDRGGCFVESDRGAIDATIATRLQELEHQLFGHPDEVTGGA
ncbi:MAG: FliH/SctL family protein [candidate division KSB1 bacterium]|nr:FliH/SctL family protein [candidate division KSB1 bacterium]